MNKILSVLILLSVLAPACFAGDTIDDIPNPKQLNGTGVSDPDAIRSGTEIDALNRRPGTLEQRTGAQFAIVIVESLGEAVPKAPVAEASGSIVSSSLSCLRGRARCVPPRLRPDRNRVPSAGTGGIGPDARRV